MQKTSVAVPPPSVKRFSFNGLTPADEKVDKNTKKSLKLKNNVQVSNSLTVPSMVIFLNFFFKFPAIFQIPHTIGIIYSKYAKPFVAIYIQSRLKIAKIVQ